MKSPVLPSVRSLPLLAVLLSLVLGGAVTARAADVTFISVIKAQKFRQETASIARLRSEDEGPFDFEVAVDLTGANTVSTASIRVPVSLTQMPLQAVNNGNAMELQLNFDNPYDLNEKFPDGTYQLTLQANTDGLKTVNLNLTGGAYPSVPRVSNFTSAQTINAGANFTLMWDAPGLAAGDFVQVFIEDGMTRNTVFESPAPGAGGALNGTSTSVMIPAGTLQPGRIYEVELTFARLVHVNTTDYAGVTAVAAYLSVTHLDIATSGASADTSAPSMFTSVPFNGAFGVPRNAVIAFHFNEPMQTGVTINWTGSDINPANFSYAWGRDANILYAVYSGNLPASTQIGWELNATGSAENFRDLAGNKLGRTTGNFNTEANAPNVTTDVGEIVIFKGAGYYQTGATPVNVGYVFAMEGDLNAPNSVTNATLSVPGGKQVYPDRDFRGDTLDYEASYLNLTDLERFFPNGSYTLAMNTVHDGTKTVNLTFPANAYPNAPTCNNLASLQALNHAGPVTISWDGFSGGTSGDVIFLSVRNQYDQEVFHSPEPGEPGALNGTHTSIQIPAGTLSPGRTYYVELEFGKIVQLNTTDYAGVTVVLAFGAVTEFEIKTTGSPIQPVLSVGGSGTFNFYLVVSGEKQWRYRIEASSDLVNWAPIQQQAFTWETGTGGATDYDSQYLPFRYYRAKDAPTDDADNFNVIVSIHGYVRRQDNNQPIAGAVVATSLDGRTATTAADGSFFLQTQTAGDYTSTPYTITVTKGGFATYSVNQVWGGRPRNQLFQLFAN